ncbi:MAG: threonine ammonia-lyase [Acidimicrobiales bacterium]
MGIADIEAVRPAVEKVAIRTPLFNSRLLTERVRGSRVLLKAENLQRTGSFKIRGVSAKLAALGDEARPGIVVASAGNHAQAAAFGARQAGVPCHVFMPAEASISKAEATLAYGATIHLEGDSVDECLALAAERTASTGEILVHPFDDPSVIAGQGTLGLELVEDIDDLALVVVPLGGGGLTAGIAIALKALRPEVRIVAVQAASCAPYPASLKEGRPVAVESGVTLADGIAVKHPGKLTLPIIAELVDDVVCAGEDDIADAMVLCLERAKLVVEGAGAVGMAAVLAGAIEVPASGTTVLVLSGGNVDSGLLAPAIRRHESNAGRRLVLFARVSDRPGQLARLLTIVGSAGGNLVTVEHLREGYDLHVRETGVHLVLETRNPEHAEAVVAAARGAGYEVQAVGDSPSVRVREAGS